MPAFCVFMSDPSATPVLLSKPGLNWDSFNVSKSLFGTSFFSPANFTLLAVLRDKVFNFCTFFIFLDCAAELGPVFKTASFATFWTNDWSAGPSIWLSRDGSLGDASFLAAYLVDKWLLRGWVLGLRFTILSPSKSRSLADALVIGIAELKAELEINLMEASLTNRVDFSNYWVMRFIKSWLFLCYWVKNCPFLPSLLSFEFGRFSSFIVPVLMLGWVSRDGSCCLMGLVTDEVLSKRAFSS